MSHCKECKSVLKKYEIDICQACEDEMEHECFDCEETFRGSEGRYDKYDIGVWVCYGCHEERREDD